METILDAMRKPSAASGFAVVIALALITAGIWLARAWLRRTERRE
jgi:predicted transporter